MPTFEEDGTSTNYKVSTRDIQVHAVGTFGSGTLHIETYGDDGAWHSISTLTADGNASFKNLGTNGWRLRLDGATSPSIWYDFRGGGGVFVYGDVNPDAALLALTGYAPTATVA